MESELLIGGLMVALSVAGLLAVILTVARAIREEPRKVKTRETAPVLRPASGW